MTVRRENEPGYACARAVLRRLGTGKAAILLSSVGAIGLLVGLLAVLPVAWVNVGNRPLPPTLELPWSGPETIAGDGQRIFIGLTAYSRVQAYSAEGHFLGGWGVQSGGGLFEAYCDAEGNLHVVTARGNRHLVYSAEGDLQEQREANRQEFERLSRKDDVTVTPNGTRCRLIRSGLGARVVCEGNGVVASSPWYLWPLSIPFPGLAFGVLGVAFLLFPVLGLVRRTRGR